MSLRSRRTRSSGRGRRRPAASGVGVRSHVATDGGVGVAALNGGDTITWYLSQRREVGIPSVEMPGIEDQAAVGLWPALQLRSWRCSPVPGSCAEARRVRKTLRSTWTALAPGASSARVEDDTQSMGANRPPQVICGHSFSRRDLDVEGTYGDERVARRGGGSEPFRDGPLQAGGPRPEHPVHGRITG
jgi:hypothetical protein